MNNRISKLPKWAQQRIRENVALRDRVAVLEAEIDRLKTFAEPVVPDVPVPQSGNTTKGYAPLFLGEEHRPYIIQYGWSTECKHKTTDVLPKTTDEETPDQYGWRQKGIPLFSTKERALRSLQYQAFQHYLAIMEKIAGDLKNSD